MVQMTSSERASYGTTSSSKTQKMFGTAERFKDARRHSRRVRFIRVVMPTIVVAGLLAAGGFAYFNPFQMAANLPVALGRASLSGSAIKMEFPKVNGFTNDNRAYNLTAEAASQDLSTPNRIDLETIKARLELADNGWATLNSATGSYDTKTQLIQLGGGIRVATNSGYAGKLQEASIDMPAGRLTSDKPVELTSEDGRLTADHMEVTQKDARALFTGNVSLLINPPKRKAASAGAAGGPAPATP